MQRNFEQALKWTLAYEGGFSKDPRDPGNWTGGKVNVGKLLGTKYGIAANSFPNLDIPNITIEQAGEIYLTKYWHKVPCDPLPAGVDALAFDIAVNSGPGRVKPWLASTGNMPAPDRVKAISAKRASFFQSLRTFSTFGKGWIRRCADLEAKCLKMALSYSPVTAASVLLKESDKSKKAVKTNTGAATASGGSGLAAPVIQPSAPIEQAATMPQWAVWLLAGSLIAITVYFIYRALVHQARAKAMQEVANG